MTIHADRVKATRCVVSGGRIPPYKPLTRAASSHSCRLLSPETPGAAAFTGDGRLGEAKIGRNPRERATRGHASPSSFCLLVFTGRCSFLELTCLLGYWPCYSLGEDFSISQHDRDYRSCERRNFDRFEGPDSGFPWPQSR